MYSFFDPRQPPARRRPEESVESVMGEYYNSPSEILWDVLLASVPLLVGIWFKPRSSVFATAVVVAYWLTNTFGTTGLFWYYVFSIVVWWILESYGEYRDVAQPGKKPTVAGWLRVAFLVHLARVNVLEPPRLKPTEEPYRGRIFALRKRRGPRPTVRKVAPTRQVDQQASPAMFYRLVHMLRMYQFADAQTLQIKMSFLEDGIQALFWNVGDRSVGAINQREEWGGEIAHVHATDSSLHVLLHPEDVKAVIEAGWGERHPLCANEKWFFRFLYHGLGEKPLPVPAGWTLIYAPRNNNELDTIRPIVAAAIWYATQGALHPVTINTQYPDPVTTLQDDEKVKRYPWWEFLYGLIPAPPATKTVGRPCMCPLNCSGTTVTQAVTITTAPTPGDKQTQRKEEGGDARIDEAMAELDLILAQRERATAHIPNLGTSLTQAQHREVEQDENNAQMSRPPTPNTPTQTQTQQQQQQQTASAAAGNGGGSGGINASGRPAPISDPGGLSGTPSHRPRIGRLARTMYPISPASPGSRSGSSSTGVRGAGTSASVTSRRRKDAESDPGVGMGRRVVYREVKTGIGNGNRTGIGNLGVPSGGAASAVGAGGLHSGRRGTGRGGGGTGRGTGRGGRGGGGGGLWPVREEDNPGNTGNGNAGNDNNWGEDSEWDDFF